METETFIGIILITFAIFYPIFLVGKKMSNMRDRTHLLESELENAKTEAKKSAKECEQMQKRIHVNLMSLLKDLSWMLRDTSPEEANRSGLHVPLTRLTAIHVLWVVNGGGHYGFHSDGTYAEYIPWVVNLQRDFEQHACKRDVTAGHLATWRTEIAAAQVYLLQLDGKERMGMGGGSRYVDDDELPELAKLKGGMRWIIDRTKTGNCPFEFGPYIVRDLETIIARIEALGDKKDKET